MIATGSCNCGCVQFEINTEISDVYICHCSLCRKSTGSGGIAVVIVANEKFIWTNGAEAIKTWTKPGHDWQSSFCDNCGSSLPGKNDDTAVYVPVGLLDKGHENLKVKHHLYVGSQAPWEKLEGDGVQHQNNYKPVNIRD